VQPLPSPSLGPVERTARVFEMIRFADVFGAACSLEATTQGEPPTASAIWLGIGERRMHLDRAKVEGLMAHLQHWLAHGTFQTGA
jgi:hypothetical protein